MATSSPAATRISSGSNSKEVDGHLDPAGTFGHLAGLPVVTAHHPVTGVHHPVCITGGGTTFAGRAAVTALGLGPPGRPAGRGHHQDGGSRQQ